MRDKLAAAGVFSCVRGGCLWQVRINEKKGSIGDR